MSKVGVDVPYPWPVHLVTKYSEVRTRVLYHSSDFYRLKARHRYALNYLQVSTI